MQLSFGEYPASAGWTAAMILNQIGSAPISITGSASGDNFIFTIPAATTAAMGAGLWTWAARVTLSGQVATADAGDFTLLGNYASTLTKSMAQQQLDAANTALLALVANPDSSSSFNGQSYSKENQASLLDIIRNLKSLVRQEEAEAAGLRGDAPSRSVRPYFV